MHAVVISEPGGPEVLQWTEVADPRPGPGEVLVEVAAAGVNRADLMQRQGLYPPPPGAPPYPGLECSGTVAALGDGVTRWHVGEQVCALLSGGGYAEQVAVPAGQLLPVPKSTTLIEAAALPETVCTVYSNVFLGARLAVGETLLIHGGGSGIGTMAIQLAKHAGARVAVTAGSREQARRLPGARRGHHDQLPRGGLRRQPHGGHRRPRRRRDPGHHRRRLPGPQHRGARPGRPDRQHRHAAGPPGRARLRRADGQARHDHARPALRARPQEQKASIVAAVAENVWPVVDAGVIRPVIDTELPMARGRARRTGS